MLGNNGVCSLPALEPLSSFIARFKFRNVSNIDQPLRELEEQAYWITASRARYLVVTGSFAVPSDPRVECNGRF
jgi:hypothetical protein